MLAWPVPREPVLRVRDEHDLLVVQVRRDHLRMVQRARHAHLDLLRQHPLQHFRRAPRLDGDVHGGVTLVERLEYPRQHRRRYPARRADVQPSRRRRPARQDRLLPALQRIERPLRIRQERPSRIGQAHAPPHAVEQRLAEVVLQQNDAGAERRLRDPQLGRRAAERVHLHRRQERFQLAYLHNHSPCAARPRRATG